MWGFSVPGYEENNQHFSPCSLRWVAPVLRAKSGLCFRSKNELQALCGNGIVEEKEECDVGFVEKDQEEKCCDENCQFKPNVTCSDFNAPCCKDCMVANSSIVCEQKNELTCSGGAFCDGRNLDCPPPSYLPDNTSCVDLGKCQGGRCLNFCQLRGIKEKKTLKPCLCSQNTTAMCRRCCLEEKGDDKGECFPTSVVQENERTCQIGKCDKGECVKVVQQLSHRIFLFIQRLNTDQLVEFMKSNIVGTVIILSLVVWIPVSCIVSCADKRKRKQRDKFRERLRKANQEAQVKDYRIRNSALRTPTVTKSSQITGNKAQLQQRITGGPVSGRLPTVRETTRDGAAGSKGKPQGGHGAQSGQKPYGGYGPQSGKGPPSGSGTLRAPRPPSGSRTPSGPRPPSGIGTPRMPRPPGGSGTPSGPRPPGGIRTPSGTRPPSGRGALSGQEGPRVLNEIGLSGFHETPVDVVSHSTSPRPISMPANKSHNARRVHSDSSSDTGSQRCRSQESPDTLQHHSGRSSASVDPHKHISSDAGGHKLALLDQYHSRRASAHNRKDSKGSDTGSPKGEKAGWFQHPSDALNRHEDEGGKGDGGPCP
ncbi:disintegrin and metalloproteinase domain-containing protein 17-like isoform X2 [Littorina saxatilis]|uniref:disintegrin and metalloproteinase domain-containing protein 17-like isoform X2 n=1 Tax=Littorina saxatilis TaxID=31220 RepID=UPI0038B56C2A